MELWELNECVREYNRMHSENLNSRTALAWETANFVGAAFSGKLKSLKFYLKESQTSKAPAISNTEFDKKLALMLLRQWFANSAMVFTKFRLFHGMITKIHTQARWLEQSSILLSLHN